MTNTGKRDARLIELLAAFNAACEPMARAANIGPGDQSQHKAYEAAQAQHDAAFNEICNTPATTLAGIVAKLETRQCIEIWLDQDGQPLDELDFESRAAVSALRDARRLTIP